MGTDIARRTAVAAAVIGTPKLMFTPTWSAELLASALGEIAFCSALIGLFMTWPRPAEARAAIWLVLVAAFAFRGVGAPPLRDDPLILRSVATQAIEIFALLGLIYVLDRFVLWLISDGRRRPPSYRRRRSQQYAMRGRDSGEYDERAVWR